jgi:aspartokinase
MPFFCSGDDGESVHSSFCVAAADALQIDQILLAMGEDWNGDGNLQISEQVAKIERVGTLTLFPHRHSPALLGRVTASLAGAGIVIHSLCTSISALSVNIDYGLLEQAAALLQSIVVLPDHHAPFRADFAILQIKR